MNSIRSYGRSALTATYLLVATGIPLYIFVARTNLFGGGSSLSIDTMVLAEFATVSLLICAGAVLGRLKMVQYLLLGLLFVPAYMLNEWMVLEGGFDLVQQGLFVDTGGSILIHMFGAVFGWGVMITMTTKSEFGHPMPESNSSEIFSLLGSMVLWVFWPSFCAALVPIDQVSMVALNVVLALCGATLSTYVVTVAMRRKIEITDIANATLAGGVAIGSVCDHTTPEGALLLGVLAGVISVFGFARIQPWIESMMKKKDTCGVMYLHGLPGLFGGLAALLLAGTVNPQAQLAGILVSLVTAVVTGFIAGKIVVLLGHRTEPYIDEEELILPDS
jgi:ammonium transporter Rh